KIIAIDDKAIAGEVEIVEREAGRHGLVAILLAGITGNAIAQEMNRAVAEGEVRSAGVAAGPGVTRTAGIGQGGEGRVDRPGGPPDDLLNTTHLAVGAVPPGPDSAYLLLHVA